MNHTGNLENPKHLLTSGLENQVASADKNLKLAELWSFEMPLTDSEVIMQALGLVGVAPNLALAGWELGQLEGRGCNPTEGKNGTVGCQMKGRAFPSPGP